MKHGYANVTGNATPPIKPAKLAKNGVATPTKKDMNPEKIRILVRSHHGHGLFIFLVYFDSMSSKIGMLYIWNEHKQFTTTEKLVNASTNLDMS